MAAPKAKLPSMPLLVAMRGEGLSLREISSRVGVSKSVLGVALKGKLALDNHRQAKFQPGDKVRFSNRATKYAMADLRKRTRTIVDMFYDPVDHCCLYELGARGNGTLGYFFRSFMLLPANGNQYTIGRPRQKRRYNRHTKLLFKPLNQNLDRLTGGGSKYVKED